MPDREFHHRRLPDHSSLLAGQRPEGWEVAWRSERLQVLFNNTKIAWRDDGSHAHAASDEIFIVLEGTVVIEVDGKQVEVGPGEFCCFPEGLTHSVVETRPPLRTFMLRAPSIDDKL